ncbi:hypothetical protein [Nevskia ramosa]|uniref:hypothetical protein n=1 Tax=Nevskia ramosa TaxID=64002 RepID=UPI002352E618|nr:hypothetical protein [Nevskia ramosa]
MPTIKKISHERKESDSFLRTYSVDGLGEAEVSLRRNVRGDWKGVVIGTSGLFEGKSKSLSGFHRPKAEALSMASRTLDQWVAAERAKVVKKVNTPQATAVE